MVNVFLGRKTLPLVVCSMFLLASLAAFGIKERNPAPDTDAVTTEDGLPEHVRLLMQKSTGNLEPNHCQQVNRMELSPDQQFDL
jgi:hypothetical protein